MLAGIFGFLGIITSLGCQVVVAMVIANVFGVAAGIGFFAASVLALMLLLTGAALAGS